MSVPSEVFRTFKPTLDVKMFNKWKSCMSRAYAKRKKLGLYHQANSSNSKSTLPAIGEFFSSVSISLVYFSLFIYVYYFSLLFFSDNSTGNGITVDTSPRHNLQVPGNIAKTASHSSVATNDQKIEAPLLSKLKQMAQAFSEVRSSNSDESCANAPVTVLPDSEAMEVGEF